MEKEEIREIFETSYRKGEELRDALEVPGTVLAWETISVKDAVLECHKIMDRLEASSIHKLGDIPEGKDKDRLRHLLKVLGQDVRF